MKINKIFLVTAVLTFSQALFAISASNQNYMKMGSSELEEQTLNTRFTMAPFMMNSTNKEFGFAVDFALNDQWMMGPMLSYHKYSSDFNEVGAYGFGVNTTYSLSENFDNGWFINPSFKFYSYEAKPKSMSYYSQYDAPKNVFSLSLMYGYKWFLNDGFNIRFSAGLQSNTGDEFTESSSDYGYNYISSSKSLRGGSGLSLDSDLSIGLAF